MRKRMKKVHIEMMNLPLSLKVVNERKEGKVEEQTQQSVQIETPESSSVEETQVKKPIPARSSQASEQKSVSQAEKEGDRENEDMEWKIHSNKRSRPATDSSEDATPQSQKRK
ncbi:hypothetical protein Bbelb_156780 [Branchiostoma belcheri]|nr:hypothetical protein Bbelb_156780 [Branchiostoma belcheri]